MDFSKFDKQINSDELAKQIKDALNNPQYEKRDLPAGTYITKLEKMELGATKDGRPMFKVMLRIMEGDFSKWCMFMNRTIYGTKNDANMISSVVGWLKTLDSESEDIKFINYSQFSELITDLYEDLADVVQLEVNYDPDDFNSIKVLDVYDLPF